MGQQQEPVDRLVNLIQKLQSQRETGRLIARHGNGMGAEEGMVVFVNGKVTEARIGRRTGSEALNRMSNWEGCLCQFMSSRAAPVASDVSPVSYPDTSFKRTLETPPNMLATPPPRGPVYSSQSSIETPLEEDIRTNTSSSIAPIPGVPYPVSQLQPGLYKIEQLGLSRTHRRLFLLIDGRRPLPDLMRLMGRGEEEVCTLLQDLESAMLIRTEGIV
ncbi:MAG TPA: hypothetical protein VFB12_19805 [Ktedonobacteraceae bacterium]|nr:hypothetical protein [Ktedonobacteraceae bacterium]